MVYNKRAVDTLARKDQEHARSYTGRSVDATARRTPTLDALVIRSSQVRTERVEVAEVEAGAMCLLVALS